MSTAFKKEHKLERPPRGGMATMVEAIRQGIWEEMERDPTVFVIGEDVGAYGGDVLDRKSTRLNSSHGYISYAVFCLKKKKKITYSRSDISRLDVSPLLI